MAERLIPDYEASRPTWAAAGAWDRSVHLTRALTRLGHPRTYEIVETSPGRFAVASGGQKEPLP